MHRLKNLAGFPYINPAFSIVMLICLRSTSNTRIYKTRAPLVSFFLFCVILARERVKATVEY